ncbi:MAG TPA: DNA repair protein RadA, partial [Thermoanaerobaculia bacterium]
MAKPTSLFACRSCGASSPKWLGRCPECGEWNSYVEEAPASVSPASVRPGEARARPLSEIEARAESRVATGLAGLDRVLGGGLVPGSVV